MGVQSFNDTASVNGRVAGSGGKSAASPEGERKGGNGIPSAVQTADGTENLRAGGDTKQAAPGTASASGGKSLPDVQSYKADAV